MLDPWFKKTYPFKHFKKTIFWHLFEYRVLRDAELVFFTTEQEKYLYYQYPLLLILVQPLPPLLMIVPFNYFVRLLDFQET